MFSSFQSILTLQLIRTHKAPRPEDEDYVFSQTIFASVFFFSTLHSTFLPFFSAHKVLSPQIVFGIVGRVTTLSKGWYVLPCVFQLSSLTPQFKPLSLSISPTNRSWSIDCYYCLCVYTQKSISYLVLFSFSSPRLTSPSAPVPPFSYDGQIHSASIIQDE